LITFQLLLSVFFYLFLMRRRPPLSTLFPYTTLFRSLNPGEPRPYSEYSIQITAPGFEPLNIDGTEVLSGATSIQDARLRPIALGDRKSTRLNSSHVSISYAVFCLKKKTN